MLEGYFDLDGATGVDAAENHKRLLAVQAALADAIQDALEISE